MTRIQAKRISQKTLLLSVITVGAVIFVLPFANMVLTSVKLSEELTADQLSFWPTSPIPRPVSPYAREKADELLKRPPDMPKAEWVKFRGAFLATVQQSVEAWWQRVQPDARGYGPVNKKQAVKTLTETVGVDVLTRISDQARQQGLDAMLAEVPALATDDSIEMAFNAVVPRFCLGPVYTRGSDFLRHEIGTPALWQAGAPNVQLSPLQLQPGTVNGEQLLMAYDTRSGKPAQASLATPENQDVERLYITMRSDQSWSKLGVSVILNGRQYKLAERIYIAGRGWSEFEFRIPGREKEPLSGRTFLHLADEGAAPAGAPGFAVTVGLYPTSAAGAWWAKITGNYETAFRQVPIARYIATSVSLAILSIVLTLFGSSLSAYAFARLEFPGRDILFGILLATMMIPGQVTMIPNFLINRSLGWYNTLYPLWVPSLFGSAFFIFMMRQFFLGIPRELEEAARIDGCGFLRIYWHVILPMMRPTLLTVAILAFIGSWNNFMGPLIYLNDERLYNLAFGLFKFQLDSNGNNALVMAAAFVMTLPIIAIFFLFQRYFIQGASLSGLGGR